MIMMRFSFLVVMSRLSMMFDGFLMFKGEGVIVCSGND